MKNCWDNRLGKDGRGTKKLEDEDKLAGKQKLQEEGRKT